MNSRIRYQLFCFPYAGGKSTAFCDIGKILNGEIETYYIEYPGRGTRAKEPYIDNYDDFLFDLSVQIKIRRDSDIPCVLFGYSIGALFAYDLVSKGMIEGKVQHMILGACCSADVHEKNNIILSTLDESDFWDEIISMGGVNEELIKNRKYLKLFSKALRADFRLGEKYSFDCSLPLPKCDATILFSDSDTSYNLVAGWQKLFLGNVVFEEYIGDHFFAFYEYERTAKIINERLLDR